MSLLDSLAPKLMRQIRALEALITCPIHGHQPSVLACPCVMNGTPALERGLQGVFCAEHVMGFQKEDPEADEDVLAACLECLQRRGLLGDQADLVTSGA